MGVIGYDELAKAAQIHDTDAEGGSDDAIIAANLDPDDAWKAAEQRALRLVMVATGQEALLEKIIDGGSPTRVRLTKQQLTMLDLVKIGVMDGLCIGRRTWP